MKYSTFLAAPTFLGTSGHLEDIPVNLMMPENLVTKLGYKAVLVAGLECYVRMMVSSCAQKVYVPSGKGSRAVSTMSLKSELSATNRKRLQVGDGTNLIWKAVQAYLLPVAKDLPPYDVWDHEYLYHFEIIAWDLYMLTIATRIQCEVAIDPAATVKRCEFVGSWPFLTSESKARIAAIHGIFSLFEINVDIPSFVCAPKDALTLQERLDEILEDAYLLDASRLRRFFGLGANLYSAKRDLKTLTVTIAKTRKWAKGILSASSQAALLSTDAIRLGSKMLELFPDLPQGISHSPVLIDPIDHLKTFAGFSVCTQRRLPFYRDNWAVEWKRIDEKGQIMRARPANKKND